MPFSAIRIRMRVKREKTIIGIRENERLFCWSPEIERRHVSRIQQMKRWQSFRHWKKRSGIFVTIRANTFRRNHLLCSKCSGWAMNGDSKSSIATNEVLTSSTASMFLWVGSFGCRLVEAHLRSQLYTRIINQTLSTFGSKICRSSSEKVHLN